MRNRQEIVVAMTNKYDFAEFAKAEMAEGLDAISWSTYVSLVETLDIGLAKYPALAPRDAYLQAIADNGNSMHTILSPVAVESVQPCGSCGGGKVR